MMNRSILGIVVGMALAACNESVTEPPVTEPPVEVVPFPVIDISREFDEAPLEGLLFLTPPAEYLNWRFAVDLDEDGESDHEGTLQQDLALAYRFETPGFHRLRISFFAPGNDFSVEILVFVTDTAVRVPNQRRLVDPSPDAGNFEGITMDRSGRFLYVGDFENSQIYQVDPTTLQIVNGPLPLRVSSPPFGRAEGLSVTPSDSLLVVAHKHSGASVVSIPSMTFRRTVQMEGEFFIHALDDTLALSTQSGSGLVLVDTRSGLTLHSAAILGAWHFAVSSERDLIALVAHVEGDVPTLHLLTLSTLAVIGTVEMSSLASASIVAFDPGEEKAYVMGRGVDQQSHFVLIDLSSLTIVRDVALGPGPCSSYCVANPAATVPSGRFVAMEQSGGVHIIDTNLDHPRYYVGIPWVHVGMSVTASPIEDAFYLLRSDGLLTKVRIED